MKNIYNAKFHLASCLIRMSNVTHNVLIFTHSHRAREREMGTGWHRHSNRTPETDRQGLCSHTFLAQSLGNQTYRKSLNCVFSKCETRQRDILKATSSELVFVWALGLSAVRQSVSQFMKYDISVHKLVVWIWRYPFFKDIMRMY